MKKIKLALFFTFGVSLKLWVENGLFEREKIVYEKHLEAGNLDRVYWLTYGNKDRELAEVLVKEKKLDRRIIVCPMPRLFTLRKIGVWLYSVCIVFRHWKILTQADILKTNQMDGSWCAVLAKIFLKKPLVLRTGFTLSQLENQLKKQGYLRRKLIEFIEYTSYIFCDYGIVASEHNKHYLLRKYRLRSRKIKVIGNYVDTDVFRPNQAIHKNTTGLLYVGRLDPVKNLPNLIHAVLALNINLCIFGKGEQRDELRKLVDTIRAKVIFSNAVPHSELPAIFNAFTYFVLPSFYEGMPKALLEAMSCGLVCIGTDTTGIDEVIEDKINGYLIPGSKVEDIIYTIKEAMARDNTKVALKARQKITDGFSLQKVIKEENILFHKLAYK